MSPAVGTGEEATAKCKGNGGVCMYVCVCTYVCGVRVCTLVVVAGERGTVKKLSELLWKESTYKN